MGLIKGEQIFEGEKKIPVIGSMLTSSEFLVIAKELGPEYGDALMIYAPQDRKILEYVDMVQAAQDLEELKKHPSLSDAGVYRIRLTAEKVFP